ncbi:MAG TPA: hypothetical protein PKD10_01735 [Paracoccaceae bacterium]|nr:hypothetical protein [Paracoccaceae bacterium]HMO73414.1 hypothetical protein [Paracoccaceae bacterium]
MRLAAALCLLPGAALACALPPSVVLTLPTGYYMAGAAATVAATGLVLAAAHRLPALRAVTLWERRVLLPVTLTSCLSFLCLAGLVAVGFAGSTDPMHNLLTLVFWAGVWVALPLACLVFGNLWRALNPWTGPARLIRLAFGITGRVGLWRRGYWPAVAGMLGFTWFTLVSLSPEDPRVLAQVVLVYWLVILVCAVADGEDWLERGEFLTVYLTMLSRISPFWLEIVGVRARLRAGWPGTQVLRLAPLPPSGMAFVTLALAGLTFDGLAGTFWWLDLIGQNPLEFEGRSAVQGVNTAGLLAVWALTAGTILGAIRAGSALSGRPLPAGPVMLSFLAIAAGYHGAHYLVTLLTTGQYAVAALNDPLFRGDSLLGLPPFWVGMGFLADPAAMTAVWNVQFAAILLAHLLAVVLALHLTGRDLRAVAHLPLTALMTGYTVLGLWLLSSPTGA